MNSKAEILIPSEAIARAVYARADRLERRWDSDGLASDFRDRITDAVFRHLARLAKDALPIDEHIACQLLHSFWAKNARRDFARAARRRVRLLDSLPDPRNDFDLVEDRHLVQELLSHLVSLGISREVAIAFVLTRLGETSQSVSTSLRRNCRLNVSATTVRQWARRKFPAIQSRLRREGHLPPISQGDLE